MTTIVSGVVTNGVVVPVSPLPEGAHVAMHLDKVLEVPKDLQEEFDGPERAGTGTVEMVERLAGDMKANRRLTATELRKLPRAERHAALAAAAALAEDDYRNNKELIGFDAFSEEEIDDDESSQGVRSGESGSIPLKETRSKRSARP